MAEGEKIRVVVNIGVLMVVLMDRASYQHQRPAIGETMHLRFAPDAVTLLGLVILTSDKETVTVILSLKG